MVWNSFGCSIYWKFHNPNWRTHIFQPGRAQPPTRTYQLFLYQQNVFFLPGYLRAMSWDMEFGKSRVKFHDLDLQCRFSDAMLQDLQQNYGLLMYLNKYLTKSRHGSRLVTWQQICDVFWWPGNFLSEDLQADWLVWFDADLMAATPAWGWQCSWL